MGALRAPVAAHAHVHNRGTPPAGLMRQAPDHHVTSHALAPTASTPPTLTNNAARQHCTVWPHALARHLNPRSSRRVNALRSGRSKIVLDMSRSFRWTVSESPSSEDLDPYPATIRPTPPNTPTPSNAKNPQTAEYHDSHPINPPTSPIGSHSNSAHNPPRRTQNDYTTPRT